VPQPALVGRANGFRLLTSRSSFLTPRMGQLGMAIERVIRKTTLHEANDDVRDLAYWLSRPVAERVAAVEALRKPVLEALPLAEQRLQRVYRVTTVKRG
jgi:uncharacterized membrane protein